VQCNVIAIRGQPHNMSAPDRPKYNSYSRYAFAVDGRRTTAKQRHNVKTVDISATTTAASQAIHILSAG